jgi:hypothetical protein
MSLSSCCSASSSSQGMSLRPNTQRTADLQRQALMHKPFGTALRLRTIQRPTRRIGNGHVTSDPMKICPGKDKMSFGCRFTVGTTAIG